MPRQRRRRDRRPNVFVQEESPRGREEIDEEAPVDDDGDESSSAATGSGGSAGGTAVSTGRSRRLRAQRAARQARVRSEVFTRSIGNELRKLGMLSGGIVVILVVLTIVL